MKPPRLKEMDRQSVASIIGDIKIERAKIEKAELIRNQLKGILSDESVEFSADCSNLTFNEKKISVPYDADLNKFKLCYDEAIKQLKAKDFKSASQKCVNNILVCAKDCESDLHTLPKEMLVEVSKKLIETTLQYPSFEQICDRLNDEDKKQLGLAK
jgi:hypothetical protein